QRKAISNVKDLSEDQFKARVAALGPAPEQPQDPTFLFDNPTWPGMIKKLRHNVRDVGLFSDEGGKYLGGFSMKDEQRLATTANMNAAWDAKPVQRILAREEPFTLHGVRLAMHLMVQPSIANATLGDETIQVKGFLARFLVTAPDMRETPRSWTVAERWTQPSLDEYYKVINEILAIPVTTNEYGEPQRRTLYLSTEAFEQH